MRYFMITQVCDDLIWRQPIGCYLPLLDLNDVMLYHFSRASALNEVQSNALPTCRIVRQINEYHRFACRMPAVSNGRICRKRRERGFMCRKNTITVPWQHSHQRQIGIYDCSRQSSTKASSQQTKRMRSLGRSTSLTYETWHAL